MSRSSLIWHQVHLSAPVEVDHVEAVLVGLASLSGNPRVVCEAIGTNGQVSWRIGVEAYASQRVLGVLTTQLPGVRTSRSPREDPSVLQIQAAASVRLPGSDRLPLDTEHGTEPVTRALLAGLASAKVNEVVRLQLILGPHLRPRRMRDVDPVDRRAVTRKLNQHGFGCALRIAAFAKDSDRARHLVTQMGASLRGLEMPGVSVQLRRTSAGSVVTAKSPWLWPLWLRVSDLVPLLAWPTAEPPLSGVPDRHPRLLAPSVTIPSRGRAIGRSAADRERKVAMTTDDSLRHLHLLGPTGVGKSTLMASLALQDIEQGRGVVVIDPKGDLVDDIAHRIPQSRLDDVVILDPRDESPVGINGLGGGTEADLAADTLLGVLHSLYSESWGPRTNDILHACLLTLARRGDASLVMVPLLLTNPGFRRSVVGRVSKADPLGLGSFWAWFEAISDAERQQAIAPLMNKLRPILMRPGLRAVFGQRQPKFGIEDVFTNRRILLVSLSKGSLGPEAARLLGSVVVALVWQAALGRVAIAASQRHPVMVHIDEVQDYLRLPGDLSDALTQARGLGVGFTLAHQHLGQLPKPLRQAILANARSRVSFSLSLDDAKAIASTSGGMLEPADYRSLPAFAAYADLLVDGATQPPVSIRTTSLGADRPVLRTSEVARAHSRVRFGQSLNEIERDLLDLTRTSVPQDGNDESLKSEDSLGRRRSDEGSL